MLARPATYHVRLCRDVLWEVYNGHSIAQPSKGGAAGPLWQIMDTVEADLADLKSTVTFFHNRNSGNYASEASFCLLTLSGFSQNSCHISICPTTCCAAQLSISGRTMAWAVLRCLVLLAVALYQLSFITRLFDKPKRHMRV
jgi:hypothetical protein